MVIFWAIRVPYLRISLQTFLVRWGENYIIIAKTVDLRWISWCVMMVSAHWWRWRLQVATWRVRKQFLRIQKSTMSQGRLNWGIIMLERLVRLLHCHYIWLSCWNDRKWDWSHLWNWQASVSWIGSCYFVKNVMKLLRELCLVLSEIWHLLNIYSPRAHWSANPWLWWNINSANPKYYQAYTNQL